MKKVLLYLFVLTCILGGTALTYAEYQGSAESDLFFDSNSVMGTSPVYRFWSNTYLHHFYTISEADKNYVIATWPDTWTYEGPVFYAYTTQVTGTLPIYRFWSNVYLGHFYTISEAEKNYVIATWPTIWAYEGPAFYAYPTQVTGTLPVYRFWSDAFLGHFYTISETEKNYVIATWPTVWTYEGPVFYAYSASTSWNLYGDCECERCTLQVWVDGSMVNVVGYGFNGDLATYIGAYNGTHKVGVYRECDGTITPVTSSTVSPSEGQDVKAYLDTCSLSSGTGHITVGGSTVPPVSCN